MPEISFCNLQQTRACEGHLIARSPLSSDELPAHAVILAGGRGTRFWPRSRTRTPKQLLNIVGKRTMLEQTVERLSALIPPSRIWVVTNQEQERSVRKQVPHVPRPNILTEPVGRNTAAAIGLAAAHLLHERQQRGSGDALMAVLPADHFIAEAAQYLRIMRAALDVAAQPGALVVMGIPSSRAETGYGYIEVGNSAIARDRKRSSAKSAPVYAVKRFTEKPSLPRARRYVASKRYLWNAGMFFWRVSTFLENLERYLPKTYAALLRLAETIGTSRYARTLERVYPQLENISVDYAVLEPASRHKDKQVFVLPAAVGWSDIGSWQAVYELLAQSNGTGNRTNVSAGPFVALEAEGNFLWSPKKFVAAVGIHDLVIVDTADALLICPRDRAQDVGRIVKWLESHRGRKLL